MSQTKPPPRLHIVFAKRKPRAAILSRGPSDWYHVVAWDTAQDVFAHGAWFKGRIYEEKCDLSPDGELLLYFALKGGLTNSAYQGIWTAVSRLPWLYALTLWPEGSTWGSGGCFTDDRTIVLPGCQGTHPDHPLNGLRVMEKGECPHAPAKPEIPDAEWSGFDHGGYPVFARDGKLYRQLPREDRELANFNGLEPTPTEAPLWAKQPLPALNAPSLRKPTRGKPRPGP